MLRVEKYRKLCLVSQKERNGAQVFHKPMHHSGKQAGKLKKWYRKR